VSVEITGGGNEYVVLIELLVIPEDTLLIAENNETISRNKMLMT